MRKLCPTASHIQALLLASTLGLSGCAAFSDDNGMTVVSGVAGKTIKKDVAFVRTSGQAEQTNSAIARLLSRPLTADAAVQVALLNNKGLQASYNELALAETELVQDSLPPNPTFSISRIAGDGASEAERQVVG
ncbi:MAG: TolC family protein, partial [Bradyrhizobium sp.]|nr:TolC family protein [Bradyrhizobium sp.]